VDVISSTLLLLLVSSNIALWFRLGRIEGHLKRLNEELHHSPKGR